MALDLPKKENIIKEIRGIKVLGASGNEAEVIDGGLNVSTFPSIDYARISFHSTNVGNAAATGGAEYVIYTVPANKKLYITSTSFGSKAVPVGWVGSGNAYMNIESGVEQTLIKTSHLPSFGPESVIESTAYPIPIVLVAGEILKLVRESIVTAGNYDYVVEGGFYGYLQDV